MSVHNGDTKTEANARHLQANKAWNWKWPDSRNRWQTCQQPKGKRSKVPGTTIHVYGKQAYYGPSKKTLAKRAAKGGGKKRRSSRRQ